MQVRIVREMDGSVVIDWTPARLLEKEKWEITLCSVPAGGLYRIETCLFYSSWDVRMCTRGDMRHHLGVGDIFLIAGQSNAAGRSKTPVCDEPHPMVHVMRPNGRWDMASHPLGETTDMLRTVSYRVADNDKLVLTMDREAGRGTKVHGAWRAFPGAVIPSDAGGLPMYSFYGLEAENE